MNSYLKTYPWLTFRLDLRQAKPRFWILLGEALSKCEHISGVPLRPATAKELHNVYLAKGIMATTAIEGNTLTESEVRARIEGALPLPPSKEYLGQEVDNILEACHEIASRLFSPGYSEKITIEQIKNYNRLVLKKLPLSSEVIPGEIRKHAVGVGQYRCPTPAECKTLLEKLCVFLNEDFQGSDLPRMAYSILKAIMAHLYLAWIHPFGDGNGRTARLLEFEILLAAGTPTPAAHLLSNHYNATRHEYYRLLDYASRSGGDVMPFLDYAIQGFVDGLREQLAIIREQQHDVAWRNYIHELFKDKTRKTNVRRRQLALDLSQINEPTPVSKIRRLSPRLAEYYAQKSPIVILRDIDDLIRMGLVEKTKEGIRAKREIILSFLPQTRRDT
ncbi:MAG: Fic family protein [Candidatus Omnitrophota bacterium]